MYPVSSELKQPPYDWYKLSNYYNLPNSFVPICVRLLPDSNGFIAYLVNTGSFDYYWILLIKVFYLPSSCSILLFSFFNSMKSMSSPFSHRQHSARDCVFPSTSFTIPITFVQNRVSLFNFRNIAVISVSSPFSKGKLLRN